MHVSQGPTKVDVRFLLEYEKKILRTNKDLIENGARRQVNLDGVKKSISESEKRIQLLQNELLQGVTEVDPRMYYNNSQVPVPVQNQMQQSMMQNQPIMMQPAMMAGQPVMMQPAMVQPGMQPIQMQQPMMVPQPSLRQPMSQPMVGISSPGMGVAGGQYTATIQPQEVVRNDVGQTKRYDRYNTNKASIESQRYSLTQLPTMPQQAQQVEKKVKHDKPLLVAEGMSVRELKSETDELIRISYVPTGEEKNPLEWGDGAYSIDGWKEEDLVTSLADIEIESMDPNYTTKIFPYGKSIKTVMSKKTLTDFNTENLFSLYDVYKMLFDLYIEDPIFVKAIDRILTKYINICFEKMVKEGITITQLDSFLEDFPDFKRIIDSVTDTVVYEAYDTALLSTLRWFKNMLMVRDTGKSYGDMTVGEIIYVKYVLRLADTEENKNVIKFLGSLDNGDYRLTPTSHPSLFKLLRSVVIYEQANTRRVYYIYVNHKLIAVRSISSENTYTITVKEGH